MALNGLACFVGTTLASSLLASWHRNADFMDAVSNTQDHMRGQKLHKIVITGPDTVEAIFLSIICICT